MTQAGERSDHAQHILIVEDDGPIRRILCDVTADLGLHPIEARDSSEALAVLNGGVDDLALVILDLLTPGIGGEALARAIRENPRRSEVPILLLSASDPRDLAILATRLEARSLPKPFDLPTLEHEILNALGRGGASA